MNADAIAPGDAWFTATYRVAAAAADIEARALAIAVEQSVEMPVAAVRERRIRDEIVGRVDSIVDAGNGRYDVGIRLAVATTGLEAGQLLNMAFGNTSLQPDVELIGLELPAPLAAALGGPRFGIAGIRAALGVADRPLACTALKPQGLAPAELATLAATFARAGIDVIKDDHGIADQAYAPFAARVQAVQRAVDQVNRATGTRTIYAPTLSGSPSALFAQARIAREEGVGMVLFAPMLAGIPVLQELVRDHLHVPVLAHPAFAGALRISPALLLGQLFRIFGADAVIFPNHGGRFSYSSATCRRIAEAARAPVPGIRSALPVPAGGMSVARVREMREFYGEDTMFLIGGALLSEGDRMADACRDFVAGVRG